MSQYYSIQEAADQLNVDYKVVYRLVKEMKIPSTRVGWQYRIRQGDLNAYLNAQRVKQSVTAETLRAESARAAAASSVSPAAVNDAATEADTRVADGVAPAAQAVATPASAPPNGITRIRARQMEQNFINRFEEKVESIDVVRNPVSGGIERINDWFEIYEQTEEQEALMQAMNSAFLDARTLATTPRNVTSRYTVPGPPQLVIEARFVAHLDAFCDESRGYADDAPADEEDLMMALDVYQARYKEDGASTVAGLASPTGWSEEARYYITGSGRGDTYHHRAVHVYLIDLRSEAVRFNANDEVAVSFKGLYELPTDAENVAELQDVLRAQLAARPNGFVLSDFARSESVSEELALAAARTLFADDDDEWRLIPDKSEGWILSPTH